MGEDGYTLVEVLAALLIIGLSLSAMVAAIRVVTELQHRGSQATQTVERARAISSDLGDLLEDEGPFSSSGGVRFIGDKAGFHFDCGGPTDCEARSNAAGVGRARLLIRAPAGTRTVEWRSATPVVFNYIGSRGASDHWPPDNPTNWQRLRAVALSSGGGDRPLALVRIWTEGRSAPFVQGAAQ